MTRRRKLLYLLFYIAVALAILFVRLVIQPRYGVNYSFSASSAAEWAAIPDIADQRTPAAWTVPG